VIASLAALALAPAVALTASPPHVTLVGSARQTIRVANPSGATLIVDVTRAGLRLGPRGRPHLLLAGGAARGAASWLVVRPHRIVIAPRGSAALTVSAAPPRGAAPGEHAAVVLLTTYPVATARVAVRLRIGITVSVRVAGRVVHALALRGVRVRSAGARHVVELRVANAGNVVEHLGRSRLEVTLLARGRVVERLRPAARELPPHSTAVLDLRSRARVRGLVAVVVRLAGRRRTVRLRLPSTRREPGQEAPRRPS
jgi:hypothetical protein